VPDSPGSETSSGISGHIRAYPGISRHIRAHDGRRMRYRPSPGMASGMIVAYRIAGRRARRERWSSRALWPVTGHGVSDGRRVPYRPSPDRVRYGPSPDRVSSRPCSFRRPRCPYRVPGRANRRPVVCHVPAQHGAVADAATGGVRTFILLYGRGVLSWRVRRRG